LRELKTPPRTVFVVHGEAESSKNFSNYIREQTGWHVHVPTYQDTITLN
jgi:metallo-beta-lactamase family protein